MIGLGFVATGNAIAQSSSVVREFATRPSMSVKAIVTTPEKAIGQVILLPGGGGDIGLNASGQITTPQMADNFTVRTRSLFVDAGYITIVLDTTSDVINLISPTSRDSIAKNRDDVVAVAATLKKLYITAKMLAPTANRKPYNPYSKPLRCPLRKLYGLKTATVGVIPAMSGHTMDLMARRQMLLDRF